jgi:uncharacterized membrane protein (UPF0136 family)
MWPKIVLWIYIGSLIAGGLVGYLKAGSRMSLVTALVCAALLAAGALGLLPFWAVYVLVGLLGGFFLYRFLKTGKFMPAGVMAALSGVILALLIVFRVS